MTSTTEVQEVITLNSAVEDIYVNHINAGIENNGNDQQTVRDLASLIESKVVTADDMKATIKAIWDDTKIKTCTIKAGHVQDLAVTVYILDTVAGAEEEKLGTILTLATRVRKDIGTKGFKAHVQKNKASVKALRDATRSTAQSQADNAHEDTLDALATYDMTIESVLEGMKVFLAGHKDIEVTDKPLLKGVIHALMALDKVSA